MRHAFSFPVWVRDSVRTHVRRAVEAVDSRRYGQEPSYTTALLTRLEGVAYEGEDGSVIITATDIDSIGPHAAERWSGADFAITAQIAQGADSVNKAILVQAKLGTFESLPNREKSRLVEQIDQMRQLTRSPKVLFIRENEPHREPYVASGTYISGGSTPVNMALDDYFVRRILTTLDGDTRPGFVAGVQDSRLAKLQVATRFLPPNRLQ